jgi:hypothetical protein
MLTVEQIQNLDRAGLNRMTSEQYKETFDDPTLGDAFRKRIDFIENSPKTAPTQRPNGRVRADESVVSAPTPTTFDPSWDDSPNPPAVAAPAPALVAATEGEEKVHSYQPVDRNGRPVGGKQVFKYRTDAELIEKLTKAHSASSARIRELSRDRKLDSIASAGKAPRTQPEKEIPTTVEGLAAELRAQRESNFVLSVRAAVNEFQASVDWAKYRSNENAQSVILAVERAGDDPTDPASYQRAFLNMQQFLEPVVPATAAATVEPTPAPAPAPKAATPAPVTPAVRPANTARIATGLSNADQTSLEDPVFEQPIKVVGVKLLIDGKSQVMDFRSWDHLSSDSQKKILRNSANAAAINALYDAENERRAAARSAR